MNHVIDHQHRPCFGEHGTYLVRSPGHHLRLIVEDLLNLLYNVIGRKLDLVRYPDSLEYLLGPLAPVIALLTRLFRNTHAYKLSLAHTELICNWLIDLRALTLLSSYFHLPSPNSATIFWTNGLLPASVPIVSSRDGEGRQ